MPHSTLATRLCPCSEQQQNINSAISKLVFQNCFNVSTCKLWSVSMIVSISTHKVTGASFYRIGSSHRPWFWESFFSWSLSKPHFQRNCEVQTSSFQTWLSGFWKFDLKKAWWSACHIILTVLLRTLSTSCRGCGLSHIFSSSVSSQTNGVRIKCDGLNLFRWSMGMILQTYTMHHNQLFGSLLFVDFIFLVCINRVSSKSSEFLYFIFVQRWTYIQYFSTIL